jgi:hypothetical protein
MKRGNAKAKRIFTGSHSKRMRTITFSEVIRINAKIDSFAFRLAKISMSNGRNRKERKRRF